jgi:hypothetical protein
MHVRTGRSAYLCDKAALAGTAPILPRGLLEKLPQAKRMVMLLMATPQGGPDPRTELASKTGEAEGLHGPSGRLLPRHDLKIEESAR